MNGATKPLDEQKRNQLIAETQYTLIFSTLSAAAPSLAVDTTEPSGHGYRSTFRNVYYLLLCTYIWLELVHNFVQSWWCKFRVVAFLPQFNLYSGSVFRFVLVCFALSDGHTIHSHTHTYLGLVLSESRLLCVLRTHSTWIVLAVALFHTNPAVWK